MNHLVPIYINDIKYHVIKNSTLIHEMSRQNIEVPRFCFNEYLSIAGNCRLCLVEIKNNIKPIASCAVTVSENMFIYTNTTLVKEARENVLEFLLINHPLDCPICDQGGECDLQDQAFVFGSDKGRYYEHKRAVLDKYCGPLIKMIMTRCIHCTRCVRFFEEVSGSSFFGMFNRGSNMEIDLFRKKNLVNFEMSGNVIDLCPVGALTSKASAFLYRSWELSYSYTIDFFDSYCSDIRIDFKNDYQAIRVLPNIHVYNNFITDKTRFFFDILNYKRITLPYMKKDNCYYKLPN